MLIVLEEGAEAEVWEQHLSGTTDNETMLATSIVELRVGQNARLRFVGAQDLNEKTWVFGSQRAEVARDGAPGLGHGSASARGNGKVFTETLLAGEGSHARVTGAYAAARPPARGLPHAAGARRGQHDVRPGLPRHPGGPLVRSSGAG